MSGMTEEAARELWCPFGLVPHYARDVGLRGVVAANRAERSFEDHASNAPERGIPSCHCIASKCMMWRWQPSLTVNNQTHQHNKRDIGFCGLAGAPA